MQPERWADVERVLDLALDSDPRSWDGLLDQQCSGDPELRRQVETLLGRYASAQRYLESPPAAAAAALVREARGTPYTPDGSRLGPWRLVRRIGRGGTSLVFLAERDDGQFTQQVALKLLRPGYDSDVDHRRFRDERQILASLNHPHIARLLDGGVSEDGLPFIAMELVEGEPIDRYCATRGLTLRRRLDLFVTVAEATQYAHRNLVIHRDLKPSNILVTADGQVKLLDFGLAKLLEPAPAEGPAAVTTQRWMTPEYAAPEQVLGRPATTLTDVYQLGVVLFELLTGTLPFGTRGQTAYDLERAILENDPPAPSAVTSDRALRGDLDAIVMKALRKQPEDRYASVQAMAEDVRRHLSGHPVLARPPTAGYRVRRYVRRNGWALAAATAGVLLVGVYAVTVTVQRDRVAAALAQATVEAQKAEQVTDLMLGLFEASEGGQAFRDTVTARELLARGAARARALTGQPVVRAQMLDVIGQLHNQLGDYVQARSVLDEALALRRRTLGDTHLDVAVTLTNLAEASHRRGDLAGAIGQRREARAIRLAALGAADPRTLDVTFWLANVLHESGDVAGGRALYDEWIAAAASRPLEATHAHASQLITLGQMLLYRQDPAGAERLFRQGTEMFRAIYGPRHPTVASGLNQLGTVLRDQRKGVESERVLREALEIRRAAHPDGHPDVARALRSLAVTFQLLQRYDEALPLFDEVERMYRRFLGDDHLSIGVALLDLGIVNLQLARYDEADRYARAAIDFYTEHVGPTSLMIQQPRILLGDALLARGRYTEAEPLLLEGYTAFRDRNMPFAGPMMKRAALASLVKLYDAQGRAAEAEKYRTLLAAEPPPPARP